MFHKDNPNKEVHKVNKVHILGKVLPPNDTLLETIYDPIEETGKLVVGMQDKGVQVISQFATNNATYLPDINGEVKRNRIVLPSKYVPEDDPKQLLSDVQNVFHEYVDLDPLFEHISSRYILMTWVYDLFQKVPYMRNMGPFNCGKSRFLKICTELCYHSSYLGAAVSPSVIYRWIDNYPGTIIFDEANFDHTSNSNTITQILNDGYDTIGGVTRCDPKTFKPRSYSSFGPKIIASHIQFQDAALESRFFTHHCYPTQRSDIPITLPSHDKWQTMIDLRNRLLGFRINYFRRIDVTKWLIDLDKFDHRLAEITLPLLQVTGESILPKEIMDYLKLETEHRASHLIMEDDGQVITAMYNYWSKPNMPDPLVGQIAKMVNKLRVNQSPLSDKRVGNILEILGFKKKKINKGIIVQRNPIKLTEYAKRYGLV